MKHYDQLYDLVINANTEWLFIIVIGQVCLYDRRLWYVTLCQSRTLVSTVAYSRHKIIESSSSLPARHPILNLNNLLAFARIRLPLPVTGAIGHDETERMWSREVLLSNNTLQESKTCTSNCTSYRIRVALRWIITTPHQLHRIGS